MSGTAKNAPRHLNTYEQEPAAKLLATILRHVVESFPRNPLAPEFREGNTLGPNNRHWFRAKVHEILPLFFPFFTKRNREQAPSSACHPDISSSAKILGTGNVH